ncbi:MAG: formylglycine-generating enzyme family protein [Georgfuchsia sp.]
MINKMPLLCRAAASLVLLMSSVATLAQVDDPWWGERKKAYLQHSKQKSNEPNSVEKVGTGTVIWDCTECPKMVSLPGGEFHMGSSDSNTNLRRDESPQHLVRITYSFAVGMFEVTRGEFARFVMETGYRTDVERRGEGYNWRTPGIEQTDVHPVVYVSWNDTQIYIRWLNKKSGKQYRLLSEAEWEYAARAGTTTEFYWGDFINPGLANYNSKISFNGGPTGEFRHGTTAVGSFTPNSFGLYDVHGNVWEWVHDCYQPTYEGVPDDGSAMKLSDCVLRVLRGGSWYSPPKFLRSAYRLGYTADDAIDYIGFRLVRLLP